MAAPDKKPDGGGAVRLGTVCEHEAGRHAVHPAQLQRHEW